MNSDAHVVWARALGMSGFVLKDIEPERLAEAVQVVAAGDALLAPSVTGRLIAEFAPHRRRFRPAEGTGWRR